MSGRADTVSSSDGPVSEQAAELTDEELIRGFVTDQRRRGLAAGSIEKRRHNITAFSKWLGCKPLVGAVEEDVQLFLDGRRGRKQPHLDSRTRYAWISDLHTFYVWAIRAGGTTTDPTSWIVRPRLRRLLPRPVADADLEMALTMGNRRQRTMLLLGSLAGFRCKEIAAMRREDILETYREPLLVVRGKGDKDATVPLHPDLAVALRALPLPRAGHVFLHPAHKVPMTPAQVSQEMNAFLDGLGIDATAHQLRHWFGTHAHEAAGGDLLVTQALMRHASPSNTAIYAEFSKKKASEAIRQLTVNRRAEHRVEAEQ